jgi:hypothetical protein
MLFGVQGYQAVVELAHRFEQECTRQIALGRQPYFVPHSDLGWVTAPNAKHARFPYSTDGFGYRLTSARRDNSNPVVAVYGDSHVHGDEVPDHETWLWQLQERIEPHWTVRNGGVSGYGTDQAFLRFKLDTHARPPSAALLSVTTTGLYRNLNICRSFIAHKGDFPFLKPRFVIQDSKAILVRPPVMGFDDVARIMNLPATKEHLRRFDRYYPSTQRHVLALAERIGLAGSEDRRLLPEALAVCTAILSEFAFECAAHAIGGCVLLLPVYWGRYPVGSEFDILGEKARSLGLPVIDARRAFDGRLDRATHPVHHPKSHYTAESGGWVSEVVAQEFMSIVQA